MSSLEGFDDRIAPSLGQSEARVLRSFARQARAMLGERIERIVLFGSRARGDARSESDMDVAVIVRAPAGAESTFRRALREIASEAELAEPGAVPISLLVLSAETFADLERRERRVARDITGEGISL